MRFRPLYSLAACMASLFPINTQAQDISTYATWRGAEVTDVLPGSDIWADKFFRVIPPDVQTASLAVGCADGADPPSFRLHIGSGIRLLHQAFGAEGPTAVLTAGQRQWSPRIESMALREATLALPTEVIAAMEDAGTVVVRVAGGGAGTEFVLPMDDMRSRFKSFLEECGY